MHTSDMKMTVTLDKKDVEIAVKEHVMRMLGIPEAKIVSVKINVGTKTCGFGTGNSFEDGDFKNIEVVVKGDVPNDGKLKKELQELAELERKGLGFPRFDPT